VNVRLALGSTQPAFEARLRSLEASGFATRLARHDPTLWSGDPAHQRVAANRLGWLASPAAMIRGIDDLASFAAGIAREGFTHAVLLGMGGSSLAPEVLRLVLGLRPGALDLAVLDNTSPAAVRAMTEAHDLGRTLFIISSKSGGTLEVTSFEEHCFAAVMATRGAEAGRSFIAITDPGTSLEKHAAARGYRRVFLNPPDIGGRYSALSYFGLVPAALLGADLRVLLGAAVAEAATLGQATPVAGSGVVLGAALGELALAGCDKVTLVLDPRIAPLGSWIEQLIAESTGKNGRGLVPIADEPLGPPGEYGSDRVFVEVALEATRPDTAKALGRLEAAGHPVLRWTWPGGAGTDAVLGAEFVRWEIATATAGAVLGVDPFDEPNVAEAKEATRATLDRSLAAGGIPERAPGGSADLTALLERAHPGDYFATLAYLHRTPVIHARLERLRVAVRDRSRLATTLGYGPRYLHSTGQLHKGGPNTGLFLLLTADEGEDVPIPGERFGFAALRRAQALGDLEVLERHGRRALHLHLGAGIERGLDDLVAAAESKARA
jgi:glucose-6-phosphate isomerase